ncbi:MAG: glycosyltransferase family 2 protein [Candidatus Omnitrophica bacterium]|nr:glycosyltransferase family 2 protein [Candidatus Omnitrophota bacterium]
MNRVSVFIPVFNEAEILEKNTAGLVRYLDSKRYAFEIILGSNGSTDETCRIGEALARNDARIKFFHLPQKGPGSAFREALPRFAHEAVVCLDMDLSTDLCFVDDALKLLDDYDIVVGSKIAGSQTRPLVRKLGSALFILLSRRLLGLEYRDYSIGGKAYRTPVLREFAGAIDEYTAYVLNILHRAKAAGKRIIEIGVRCVDNRRSRFNLFYEGRYKFSSLLRMRKLLKP